MLNIAHCITVLFWIYSMSESLESADAALLRLLSAQLAPASGACRCCLQIGGAFGQMPGEVLPVYSKIYALARWCTIKPFCLALIFLALNSYFLRSLKFKQICSVFSESYCNIIYLIYKHVYNFYKSSKVQRCIRIPSAL